jgi:hypothetical protein
MAGLRKAKQDACLQVLLLIWHGSEIPRSPSGRINLSAMVRANNAFTGESKRLYDRQRTTATKDYLTALAAAKAVTVENLMGIENQREIPSVLDPEKARESSLVSSTRANDTWGYEDVSTELAQWHHVELRVAVNRWVRGELTRRHRARPLDRAAAAVVRGRKNSNLWLSQVAHDRGCPPAFVHRQLTHALTGSAPEV